MVNKPDYILDIEKNDGILSIMRFHMFDGQALKYLDEKKYERVFEEGSVKTSGKAKWNEVVYKTAQPFYLHFVNESTGVSNSEVIADDNTYKGFKPLALMKDINKPVPASSNPSTSSFTP